MARDDDDLLGMLTAFEIADYVVAGFVGEFLRGQSEMHADRTFSRKMRDQVSIFGADCSGGNSGGITVASMRQAVIGAPDRADQSGCGSEFSRSCGSSFTIADALAVGC